jgi:3-phosphoshikimate 1-carboxyvinyltransferase
MLITGLNRNFDVTVNLVGSKSVSNRALMIAYYGGFTPRIRNLSSSDDTKLLSETLNSLNDPSVPRTSIAPITITCHNAGTVLRFLLPALSVKTGCCPSPDYILTGSDRMLHRPVGDLVDALRTIGADIDYLGQDGFPPLLVRTCHGASLHNTLSVDITKSSQFASSLLLAMPILVETQRAMSLHLDGDLSSLPYIDLTIDIMQHFGAKIHREGRDIFVEPSECQDVEYCVESDWTCASYWYEAVALSDNGRARLKNLHLDSTQGDAIVAQWFEHFGVKSIQDGDDVVISRVETDENQSHIDFINNPDLYPTIAATCAGLGVKAHFTGLRNLIHKESDRVAAMTTELEKIPSVRTRRATSSQYDNPIVFDTYDDHRIAMALAPLAMKIGAIEINNADVVSKSYPNFWSEFGLITPNRL